MGGANAATQSLSSDLTGDSVENSEGQVWFVHPDLGIGGAEMLIVNAAVALLKDHGRDVQIFTAHHDPKRCFAETTDGGPLSSRVHVYGSWLPRKIVGRFHAVCAILRMIWISFVLGARISLGFCERPAVIVCDVVSHVVPLLRLLTGSQVVFYCHFPDKLLCVERGSFLKRAYRMPMDWWEESSTGAADAVVVNSKFTAGVFRESFTSLSKKDVGVLYPAIDMQEFDRSLSKDQIEKAHQGFPPELKTHLSTWTSDAILLVSVNRFERKKNLMLAVEALRQVKSKVDSETFDKTHLVLAGGYDTRLEENVEYVKELQARVKELDLQGKVSFLLSFSNDQRLELFKLARCVLYTPDREHFGIVPIEAMYAGCPVVAIASGGPLETIIEGETGFLTKQDPVDYGTAIAKFVTNSSLADKFGAQGRKWVTKTFSLAAFGNQLNEIIQRHEHPAHLSKAMFGTLSFGLLVASLITYIILARLH